jgi:ketosteroid isomerase-like protein
MPASPDNRSTWPSPSVASRQRSVHPPSRRADRARAAIFCRRPVNPQDKSISVGWDAIKKNWETMFSSVSELKVTQADGPHIHVTGDVAWATGIANDTFKTKAGAAVNAPTYETDVFEKRGSQWLLVSHTALFTVAASQDGDG